MILLIVIIVIIVIICIYYLKIPALLTASSSAPRRLVVDPDDPILQPNFVIDENPTQRFVAPNADGSDMFRLF